MLDFEVLSRSAYLYTICRDATNIWEVDTPIKPPNVLFNSFLGSIAHDQMLKVWIPLSCSDMSIWWCKTYREFGKYNYCWMVHTVVCVLIFNKEKNVFCLCHCAKLNFLAFNCKLQSLNFNKYIDSGFNTHITYILRKWSLGVFFKSYLIGMLSNQFIQRYV